MAVPAASGTESDSSSGSFTWRRQQYTCLLGADYPYAADGLLIWNALREWFHSYLSLYYTTDAEVASDRELTAWYVLQNCICHVCASFDIYGALALTSDLGSSTGAWPHVSASIQLNMISHLHSASSVQL